MSTKFTAIPNLANKTNTGIHASCLAPKKTMKRPPARAIIQPKHSAARVPILL